VHLVAMLIIGFQVPNSFEFIFLQIVAGVFSVLMVNNLYRRKDLFLTAGKITLVYAVSYFSLAILQEGSILTIDYGVFAFFVGNGLLTLISFPLIYFQEKIFGFVSEISLLELSDTNNPLLRQLAETAPGTFQHSMQVANLTENAIIAIGGNALMARTGALYHDIGKMQSPMYFIENQSTGINPHDELSFEESAEIIIGHVSAGISLAKRNKLPDLLIDFIRTHHGTSTVMYFYRQYLRDFPEDKQAIGKFMYPGPKPFSKETAVLMMADTVEAASRSIQNPDHDKIDQLVEKLIDHQMNDGQFENAPITLREIRSVKKIFKKILMNIYHVRIKYPD
jgi:putative nucleotidyltransferase with HDIG domain